MMCDDTGDDVNFTHGPDARFYECAMLTMRDKAYAYPAEAKRFAASLLDAASRSISIAAPAAVSTAMIPDATILEAVPIPTPQSEPQPQPQHPLRVLYSLCLDVFATAGPGRSGHGAALPVEHLVEAMKANDMPLVLRDYECLCSFAAAAGDSQRVKIWWGELVAAGIPVSENILDAGLRIRLHHGSLVDAEAWLVDEAESRGIVPLRMTWDAIKHRALQEADDESHVLASRASSKVYSSQQEKIRKHAPHLAAQNIRNNNVSS